MKPETTPQVPHAEPMSEQEAFESLREYFYASRSLAGTLGHPDATVEDERRAEARYEAAIAPASIAAGLSLPASEAAPQVEPTERKMAPVQGWPAGIPWSLHLEAYAAYSKRWAPQKAMIEGGCRGGFSTGELDMFIPGWRERASEITALRAEVERLNAALSAAPTREAAPPLTDAPELRRAVCRLLDTVGQPDPTDKTKWMVRAKAGRDFSVAVIEVKRALAVAPPSPKEQA